MEGEPEAVMDYYNALIAENGNRTVQQIQLADGRTQTVSGTGEAAVAEIGLYNARGEAIELVKCGEPVELRVTVQVNTDLDALVLGYGVKDRLGQVMYSTNTWHTGQGAQTAESRPAPSVQHSFSGQFRRGQLFGTNRAGGQRHPSVGQLRMARLRRGV